MARRHKPGDERWAIVGPLVPPQEGPGGRFRDRRTVLNGMFWKPCSGAAWRDLPERYGPWQTAHARFRRWAKAGPFGGILRALRLRLAADGNLDYSTWLVDSTSVRAAKAAAGAKEGAAREPLPGGARGSRRQGGGRHARAPARAARLRRRRLPRRNAVERLVGWLKEMRAVATRGDKLAESRLGMVQMAMVRVCPRRAVPSNTALGLAQNVPQPIQVLAQDL